MIKRHIPPKHYHGPRPPGFKFVRFEELGPVVEGVTHDGKRIVIPAAEWWRKDDA